MAGKLPAVFDLVAWIALQNDTQQLMRHVCSCFYHVQGLGSQGLPIKRAKDYTQSMAAASATVSSVSHVLESFILTRGGHDVCDADQAIRT
jgi:hypothetical protein